MLELVTLCVLRAGTPPFRRPVPFLEAGRSSSGKTCEERTPKKVPKRRAAFFHPNSSFSVLRNVRAEIALLRTYAGFGHYARTYMRDIERIRYQE